MSQLNFSDSESTDCSFHVTAPLAVARHHWQRLLWTVARLSTICSPPFPVLVESMFKCIVKIFGYLYATIDVQAHPGPSDKQTQYLAMGCLLLLLSLLILICCIPSIRYLYRRNKKGITAKLDDDLLKFYCNEDTFLMQVRHYLIAEGKFSKKTRHRKFPLRGSQFEYNRVFQVTAIELEGAEGQESIMYDITLCELAE